MNLALGEEQVAVDFPAALKQLHSTIYRHRGAQQLGETLQRFLVPEGRSD